MKWPFEAIYFDTDVFSWRQCCYYLYLFYPSDFLTNNGVNYIISFPVLIIVLIYLAISFQSIWLLWGRKANGLFSDYVYTRGVFPLKKWQIHLLSQMTFPSALWLKSNSDYIILKMCWNNRWSQHIIRVTCNKQHTNIVKMSLNQNWRCFWDIKSIWMFWYYGWNNLVQYNNGWFVWNK